jgi:uncharacterized protein (DUF427 family)
LNLFALRTNHINETCAAGGESASQRGKVAQSVRITHKITGMLLAEGPLGWGITPFEGNYYISRKYLRTAGFKANFFPGLCPYKLLYVWLDLALDNGSREKNLGWMYWLPNPLLPFIWFRVALPGAHPALVVERYQV